MAAQSVIKNISAECDEIW